MTGTNPIFPASRAELKAFYPVLEITCADVKSSYDEVKSRRQHPIVSDVAGAKYRECVADTYLALRDGECTTLYNDLIQCNTRYEYEYGIQCKKIRDALQMCAVKNKLGELGKNYS